MAKASKQQPKPKQRSSRPNVVCFRLTDPQFDLLKVTCDKAGVLGASSAQQFARKIVCDYLKGKLDYKNKNDLKSDTEGVAA